MKLMSLKRVVSEAPDDIKQAVRYTCGRLFSFRQKYLNRDDFSTRDVCLSINNSYHGQQNTPPTMPKVWEAIKYLEKCGIVEMNQSTKRWRIVGYAK